MLAKDKLNTIEDSISKGSVDSYITHDKGGFVSVNNVLRAYGDMKNGIKNSKNSGAYRKEKNLF